jgi:hypothetical protein
MCPGMHQPRRSLHSLRPHPQLLAWRKVLVDLAKAVHKANLWIRECMYNGERIFDDANEDEDEDMYMPPPPQSFLDAFPAAAVASIHRGLRKRPRLAELLGATGCEHSACAAQRFFLALPSAPAVIS